MSNFPPYTSPVAFDPRGTGRPEPDAHDPRSADPGSPRAARVAWVLCAVLLAVIVGIQQLGTSAVGAGGASSAKIEPPSMDPTDIQARLYVKLPSFVRTPAVEAQIDSALLKQAGEADTLSRVRAVVLLAARQKSGVSAESDAVAEAVAALRRDLLTVAANPAEPNSAALAAAMSADLDLVETVRTQGPRALSAEQRAMLIDHHGWMGKALTLRDEPDTHPDRMAIAAGGTSFLIVVILVGGTALLALVAGTALLTLVFIIRFGGGLRGRLVPPAPGGSIGIEVLAVFMAGFVLLKSAMAAMATLAPGVDLGAFATAMQWSLLLVIFYPLLRGVSWSRTRMMLGLTTRRADDGIDGRPARSGVLREVAAGVVGYVAVVPLFVAGGIVSLGLVLLWSLLQAVFMGSPSAPPTNPIIDIVAGASGWHLVSFVLLATVWAPLLEEIIFRGALYRHLRSRLHWILAGAGSALIFGLMHGYMILMLGPVIMLGLGFAMIREWRGSLIACMTAHCIHNGMIIATIFVISRSLAMP
jgi:membrane protease YdiL (CAAX protease family)